MRRKEDERLNKVFALLDSDEDGFIANGHIDLMTPAIEVIDTLSDFFI